MAKEKEPAFVTGGSLNNSRPDTAAAVDTAVDSDSGSGLGGGGDGDGDGDRDFASFIVTDGLAKCLRGERRGGEASGVGALARFWSDLECLSLPVPEDGVAFFLDLVS